MECIQLYIHQLRVNCINLKHPAMSTLMNCGVLENEFNVIIRTVQTLNSCADSDQWSYVMENRRQPVWFIVAQPEVLSQGGSKECAVAAHRLTFLHNSAVRVVQLISMKRKLPGICSAQSMR